MESELNNLLEKKEAYEKEIKTLEGILSYYKVQKENNIHNKIIIYIYSISLTILTILSSILTFSESTIGIACAIGVIFAYIAGFVQLTTGIKNGEKIIKQTYKREYGIDVDELHIDKDYLPTLEINKEKNEAVLEKINNEIRKINLQEKNNKTTFTQIAPMTHQQEETKNNNDVKTLSKNNKYMKEENNG